MSEAAHENQNTPLRNWIAVLGACLGCFLAVLDIAIGNTSMKNIQATLGTSVDETSWISTAYIIAEIVTIPMTAWLISVFSIRKYILVNSVLFVFFSVLCGMATTLPEMIVARILQGLTGGALIPSAATLVLTLLPKSKTNIGLAAVGLSMTFAPAFGPVIGGWVTSAYGWQWSYFMNVAPGLCMVTILFFSLPSTPMNLRALRDGDWWGILSMAIGLGTLTFVFEEGHAKDWFSDPTIRNLTLIGILSLVIFITIELSSKNPFVNIRVLGRRNFLLSSLCSFLFGMSMYGNLYIVPRFLQQVQGYDAFQSGQAMIWGSFPQLALLPFVPAILKHVSAKILVSIGFIIMAYSNVVNVASMSHDMAGSQFILPQVIRAFGMALLTTPLAALAFVDVLPSEVPSASALFTMMRNLGGSVCVGLTSTFLDHRFHLHFARIGERISSDGLAYFSANLANNPISENLRDDSQIQVLIGRMVTRESMTMTFGDWFMASVLVLGIGSIAAMLSKTKSGVPVETGHSH